MAASIERETQLCEKWRAPFYEAGAAGILALETNTPLEVKSDEEWELQSAGGIQAYALVHARFSHT
jgi:hypothetical protein